jgi:hypothetical protein
MKGLIRISSLLQVRQIYAYMYIYAIYISHNDPNRGRKYPFVSNNSNVLVVGPLLLPFERWHISGKRTATHKFNSHTHAYISHYLVLQDVKLGAGNCYHCLSIA